ncbi:unnamed protein product [Microthlaspi erraticum]|uniref:cysteine dioxygenase n=1 Tax=Microthlaspi erraticum TaxID=1685480 RepID=A0A6D2L610_9BRAS|nr:unnamed protein product [Microthlaspi erraticum]
MGTGTAVSGRVRKDLSEISNEPNPNGNIPVAKPISAAQENRPNSLFANGNSGAVPSPENIQMLRSVLDEMKPEDVYVSPEMSSFGSQPMGQSPVVTYLHLYECHRFSIGIFCLPPSEPSSDTRLAEVKVDSEFTAPCETSILVLDVLGPPYSDPAGRHCTYYFDYPFSKFSVDGVDVAEEEKEGHAWLTEREEEPEDLTVMALMYSGPTIKE